MNKFLCLILPIIHVYNVGISWLRLYVWLQSCAQLLSEDATPVGRYDCDRISRLRSHLLPLVDIRTLVVSPNSGGASRLQSINMPHVLPPQLWRTSHGWALWLQHLTTRTLSRKQTRRDAWLVQRSKPQHLTASHVQVLGHVPCDQWTLSASWSEGNPSVQKDSVPLQLRRIKVFECLVRRAKALCHAVMALRTDHTWESP
jgi:hypothetical protein